MLLEIHPKNPETRKISQVVEMLKQGGVVIYPTDTVYAIGCDITSAKAIERICRIRGIKPEKNTFSFICNDLSHISEYTKPFSNEIFKLMKRSLPGPFTFILNASNNVPKLLGMNKKTVGIRVPEVTIARDIIKELGNPIVSASLKLIEEEGSFMEYPTDAYEIHELYGNLVDIVIDGGNCGFTPSTIIDCTDNNPVITRQGLGVVDI